MQRQPKPARILANAAFHHRIDMPAAQVREKIRERRAEQRGGLGGGKRHVAGGVDLDPIGNVQGCSPAGLASQD